MKKAVNGKLLVMSIMALCLTLFITQSTAYGQMVQKKTQIGTPMLTLAGGDLSVTMKRCPPKEVKAGTELKASFVVVGKSTFKQAVNGVVVDIVLCKAPAYPSPAPYAVTSPVFQDKMLLQGGRENIDFNGPGTQIIKLNGGNLIPPSTPSGYYYLGAVIDAGNKFKETNERNNAAFCKIKVVGQEDGQGKQAPDLTVPQVRFQKVQERTNAQGKSYWIFNVIITVKNQGSAAAGPFVVLLERNSGAGGIYENACPTCIINVGGLNPGQSLTLPPRQFNNSDLKTAIFRATADHRNNVPESNEGNNMNAETFK